MLFVVLQDIPSGPITGRFAGLLWKSYETLSQFSFRNQCLVLLDWLRTKVRRDAALELLWIMLCRRWRESRGAGCSGISDDFTDTQPNRVKVVCASFA